MGVDKAIAKVTEGIDGSARKACYGIREEVYGPGDRIKGAGRSPKGLDTAVGDSQDAKAKEYDKVRAF